MITAVLFLSHDILINVFLSQLDLLLVLPFDHQSLAECLVHRRNSINMAERIEGWIDLKKGDWLNCGGY